MQSTGHNGTQYPAFHPSNAATGQLLLLLHTGLAYLRNRYFMFSLQFQQANQDIIEHQKTAQSEKFNTVNKSVKGMTNTVRSHCNHPKICESSAQFILTLKVSEPSTT